MNIRDYDDSVEREILSIILVDSSLADECYLEPKHFLNPVNRKCYTLIHDFYQKNNTVHLESIAKESDNEVEFLNYSLELISQYYSSGNFYFLVEKQEEIYKKNKLFEIAKKITDGKIDYDKSIQEINILTNEFVNADDHQLMKANDIYDLITTSAKKLEFKRFNGFQLKVGLLQNTMNVIAARPSIGKTGFALNMMHDLSDKYKCLYFNMEMTEKEIYERLVAIDSGIPIERFSKLKENEQKKIKASTVAITKKKIKIYSGSKTYKSIYSIVAKNQRDEHCIVFIDHIGYVSTGKSGQSDTERIGECVRQIQLMTKDLNITAFTLCHINRSGKDAPSINDLKDSGELEQSAHVVMILNNPSDDLSEMTPTLNVIIGKNRSGKRGIIDFEYCKTNQRFAMIDYSK